MRKACDEPLLLLALAQDTQACLHLSLCGYQLQMTQHTSAVIANNRSIEANWSGEPETNLRLYSEPHTQHAPRAQLVVLVYVLALVLR